MLNKALAVLGVLLALGVILGFSHKAAYDLGYARGAAWAKAACDRAIDKVNTETLELVKSLRAEVKIIQAKVKEELQNVREEYNRASAEVAKHARADVRALDARITRMLNEQSNIRESVTRDGRTTVRTYGGSSSTASDPDRHASGRGGAGTDEAAVGEGAGGGAGDTGGTSEKALAEWASIAIRMYNTCRVQAQGLQRYARACAARSSEQMRRLQLDDH